MGGNLLIWNKRATLSELYCTFQELEELQSSNKSAMHEKLVAVARAKELMRQEHIVELDRIKEQLKNVSQM